MKAAQRSLLAKKSVLILVLVLATPLLAGCNIEVSDLMLELALEWATEKDLIGCYPEGAEDCEPNLNYTEIGAYAIGWGSDRNVQAAFDTASTVNSINNADALADEGFATGDASLIQQAIDARPNDWSYDQQLSVLHLSQGNEQAASEAELDSEQKAQEHLEATLNAENMSDGDPQAHAACVSTYTNVYRQREQALIAQIDKDPNASNVDFLISQLDLVRSRISQVVENNGSNPCASYGN
jgi:hypothetical protein